MVFKAQSNNFDIILARTAKYETALEEYTALKAKIPENRPRLLVAYQNGNIQLMVNETDTSYFIFIKNEKCKFFRKH